jgi:hypothetical protein
MFTSSGSWGYETVPYDERDAGDDASEVHGSQIERVLFAVVNDAQLVTVGSLVDERKINHGVPWGKRSPLYGVGISTCQVETPFLRMGLVSS